MFIKTNKGILNFVPAQWFQIYVTKRVNVSMEEIWSVRIEMENKDFVLCDCATKEEAEQALDKLWDALRKNESSYDMA